MGDRGDRGGAGSVGAVRGAASVAVADAAVLDPAAARIAAQRGFRLRGEAFDVRDDDTGTSLGRIDRGALPLFGIRAEGVHLNGLVRRPDGLHLWVALRAAHKALDPGKLDHLVAGGVPAGLTPQQTLEKEGKRRRACPLPSPARRGRSRPSPTPCSAPRGCGATSCTASTVPPGQFRAGAE